MRQRAIKRAAMIAIIVGSLLNLINQYDAIIWGSRSIDWFKIVLTYFVPFGVSIVSGWLASKDVQRQRE